MEDLSCRQPILSDRFKQAVVNPFCLTVRWQSRPGPVASSRPAAATAAAGRRRWPAPALTAAARSRRSPCGCGGGDADRRRPGQHLKKSQGKFG